MFKVRVILQNIKLHHVIFNELNDKLTSAHHAATSWRRYKNIECFKGEINHLLSFILGAVCVNQIL
jgi:hypothetical protein